VTFYEPIHSTHQSLPEMRKQFGVNEEVEILVTHLGFVI